MSNQGDKRYLCYKIDSTCNAISEDIIVIAKSKHLAVKHLTYTRDGISLKEGQTSKQPDGTRWVAYFQGDVK